MGDAVGGVEMMEMYGRWGRARTDCTPMIEAGVALATSSVTALLSAFACARPAALRTTRCSGCGE